MKLAELKPGTRAVVWAFDEKQDSQALASRMMEMGLTLGAEIRVEHEAPFGGAIAVRCRGTLIALRLEDAGIVEVKVS